MRSSRKGSLMQTLPCRTRTSRMGPFWLAFMFPAVLYVCLQWSVQHGVEKRSRSAFTRPTMQRAQGLCDSFAVSLSK